MKKRVSASKIYFNKFSSAINTFIAKIISFLLDYFFDPLFFIAALGPLIVGSNYFMIVRLFTKENPLIKQAKENPYTYALISYNIQYFVLFIVFIFFISETALAFKSVFRNLSINQVIPVFKTSNFTKFMCLFFAGIFAFMIYDFIRGSFAQVDIDLYLKEREVRVFSFWEPTWPPFKSAITQFRITFIIYAILLSLWKSQTLPHLIETSKRTPSDHPEE